MRRFSALALAFLVTLSCAVASDKKKDPDEIGNRDVGKGVNFYSLEKEIALGKQLAQEVERQAKIVDDPVIAEYVNRVGQNLVRNSDAHVPFTIKVIDAEEINAFALPGGFFFVNTGVLMNAETEAEMAGVMAHEIAHVAARHGTRQATRGQIINYASIPLIFMGGWTGYVIRQGAGLAIPLGFLKFSQGFESEADFLGLQYMYKAGYDPTAFVDFFEKIQSLEKKKPGTLAKIFSSHPRGTPGPRSSTRNSAALVAPLRTASSTEIARYVATGECRDKAGAYAIQGRASRFVPRISGSYANVVGLPIAMVSDLLGRLKREEPD